MSTDRRDEDPAAQDPGPDDTPSLFPPIDLEALAREGKRIHEAAAT